MIQNSENSQVSNLAILQARMGSTRFPGKVLEPIAGKPMIIHQLERMKHAKRIDEIIVATSTDKDDDQLVEVLESADYKIYRGSLNDVLQRFADVISQSQPELVIRMTADCPLISPNIIDAVIEHFDPDSMDYISNTMTPSFPDGLDVEVIKAEVLTEVARIATDEHEREHVTLGVYRRPDKYRIHNYSDSIDRSYLRWTVDTPEDFQFVSRIYGALYEKNPNFEYADILNLLAQHPDWNRTDGDARRNAALDGLDTGAMNVK